ncbi:MAG: hypothetical protein D6806_17395 [Deltaproteobacteria bacterium]|nr:MAG: hypothetical protein D6806_17395 [Deltaproteobacteria bacterium]
MDSRGCGSATLPGRFELALLLSAALVCPLAGSCSASAMAERSKVGEGGKREVAASEGNGKDSGQKRKPCRKHHECPSGVCSRFKADNGFCAPAECKPGDHADNNNFFCSRDGRWRRAKREGEPCSADYECYQPTCFMNPNCNLQKKMRAYCRGGKCVLESMPDPCSAKGYRKVLAPEEFMVSEDGRCFQSMAQRLLRTVCVPCGNGVCDEDESRCNCPEDCK